MEFTLNNCVSRINQALNYPSLAYEDVYHFFDQAIHELNTSLKIALPTVTEMLAENEFRVEDQPNLVNLADMQEDGLTFEPGKQYGNYAYDPVLGKYPFVLYAGESSTRLPGLYGYKFDTELGAYDTYATIVLGGNAYWQKITDTSSEVYLTEYLPFDWWTLFVIPYVCSKWAVRNGDESAHFVDEYVQGFQQLQNSYNVPNRVKLSSVAGRHAYKKLVEERLPNLNAIVFTRAIYEDMKVGNGIAPVYGGFYETGGWGV